MNAKDIALGVLHTLEKASELVDSLGPIPKALLGPFATDAVAIVSTAAALASNVLERAAEGKVVFAEKDADKINELTAKLAKANDELNEHIRAS